MNVTMQYSVVIPNMIGYNVTKGGACLKRQITPAYKMALGGVLAAMSIAVQCMGGLIPVATYVTPMLSIVALQIVLQICGKATAWAWYGAVALLGLLVAPDKEASAVFIALGYYPILKPFFDRCPLASACKGLYFNAVILLLYWLLLQVLGLGTVQEDFREISVVMIAVLLVLGNFTFFTLDKLLVSPRLRRIGHG